MDVPAIVVIRGSGSDVVRVGDMHSPADLVGSLGRTNSVDGAFGMSRVHAPMNEEIR